MRSSALRNSKDSRGKVRDIYAFISEHLYFSRPDLNLHGEPANAALLLSLLTALTGGKALVIGEPGLGKTTAAEYVCGKLNQGEEAVIWSHFARLPVKIVDEINRLPETKQSLILDGVERGKWEYLNQFLINDEFCLFATANYQDQGTNTLVPPLLDRFDIVVESKHPGANIASLIGQDSSPETILRHPASEETFLTALRGGRNGKQDPIAQAHKQFAKVVQQQCGVALLSHAERQTLRQDIAAMEVDLAANAFIRMVLSELSFCCQYGQKRSGEACAEGCHYTGYLCYEVNNCASNRLPGSIYRYARALAWWLGHDRVEVEHVRLVLPYAIAHRTQWRESYLLTRERERRQEPLMLHVARQATADVFRRFHEQQHDIMQALSLAAHCLENDADITLPQGDHPLYAEIRRDLRLE